MTKIRIRIFSVAIIAASLSVAHAAPAGEPVRIPITDPDLLVRFGFPADATNVFMRKGAQDATVRIDDESIDGLDLGDPNPNGYGTQDFTATAVSPADFTDLGASTVVQSGDLGVTCANTSPPEGHMHADVDLPSGVRWDGALWWAYDDTSFGDVELSLIRTCWPFAAGAPSTEFLATGKTTGTAGYQFLFTAIPDDGVTIDNGLCNYNLRVFIPLCDFSESHFGRARLGWFRQVSPPPPTPTFDDVPTNHPFYQHIEAIAASGVTNGCPDPNNFCPNGVLTRGQIVALLAEALGLHWPN